MPELIQSLFSNVWSVVLIVLFFGGSIFVHELGHFLAARARGLKIDRFSIGFGPRIFGWTRDGVEYRVSWIPLGGYVALPQLADMRGIEGESTEEIEKLPPISYTSKVIVAVMGAVFNILFAFVLATVLWAIKQPVSADETTTRIGYVSQTIELQDGSRVTSPAVEAGLKVGDRIVAIDGREVNRWEDVMHRVLGGTGRAEDGRRRTVFRIEREGAEMDITIFPKLAGAEEDRRVGIAAYYEPVVYRVIADTIADRAGFKAGDRLLTADGRDLYHTQTLADVLSAAPAKAVEVVVDRAGQRTTLTVPPRQPTDADKPLGAYIAAASTDVHIDPVTQIVGHVERSIDTLAMLLHPRSDVGVKKVSGPIEIIYVFHLASQAGIRAVLYITILVNISLAIFNLLPIPVLDGGHIMFATIAKLRGRAIPPNVLLTTQSVFMVLLLSMVLYVSYFNVIRVHRMTSDPEPAKTSAPAQTGPGETPADAPAP